MGTSLENTKYYPCKSKQYFIFKDFNIKIAWVKNKIYKKDTLLLLIFFFPHSSLKWKFHTTVIFRSCFTCIYISSFLIHWIAFYIATIAETCVLLSSRFIAFRHRGNVKWYFMGQLYTIFIYFKTTFERQRYIIAIYWNFYLLFGFS